MKQMKTTKENNWSHLISSGHSRRNQQKMNHVQTCDKFKL